MCAVLAQRWYGISLNVLSRSVQISSSQQMSVLDDQAAYESESEDGRRMMQNVSAFTIQILIQGSPLSYRIIYSSAPNDYNNLELSQPGNIKVYVRQLIVSMINLHYNFYAILRKSSNNVRMNATACHVLFATHRSQ